MALKSIIDIDVNTEEFAKFQAMYQKYQDQLTKQPAIAKQAGKEQNNTRNTFAQQVELMKLQARLQAESQTQSEKQQKTLGQTDRLWTSVAKSTKSVAGSIVDATRSLLSWTGILTGIGGLLGAGGLFGLDRMASTVGNERRTSMGLGMSIGQMKAFQTNFSRIVDPDAFLSWISQMESDPEKGATASALGFNLSGNAETDSLRALNALRGKSKEWNPALYGTMLSAFHVGGGVDAETLRRMRTTGSDEWNQLFAGNSRDTEKFGIQENVARQWQDFSTKLQEAGNSIFKVFVDGLTPLVGPLEHLSQGFVHFIEVIMSKNGIVEHGINKVADWLEKFSGEIGSDSFLEKVRAFTSDVGALADMIHGIVHPNEGLSKLATATGSNTLAMASRAAFNLSPTQKGYSNRLSLLEKTYGLPAGMLSYEAMRESGMDLTGKYNKPNAKGAVGTFQLTPIALKEIYEKANLKVDPTDSLQSALGAAVYSRILMDQFKNEQNALGAWNWGPGNMDSYLKSGRGAQGQPIPAETRSYMNGVRIEINNNTGGNAIASAAPLAGY